MAKEIDQTQEELDETPEGDATETEKSAVAVAEEKEDTTKAVEASKKFDEMIDASDVDEDGEEIPSARKVADEDKKAKVKEPEETGDEEIPAEDAGDEQAEAEEEGEQKKTESKISDDLRKRATDLGMIPEEIDEYGSDTELAKTVAIFEKIASEEDVSTGQPPSAQATVTPAQKQGAEQKTAAEDEFELKFANESEIDPEILAGMKKLHEQNKQLRQQVADQSAQVKTLVDGMQAERQKEVMARFDERIEKLGDDYVDTFGKGKTLDMNTRTLARQNRDKLRAHMYALAVGLHNAGQPIPPQDRLFEMAMNNVFGQKVKAVAGAQLYAKTKKRAKQAIGRGAAGKTGDLMPVQRAIKTSKEFDAKIDESET